MTFVSERALVARVNRRLARQGQRLRVYPYASGPYYEYGRYLIVDDRNHRGAGYDDLEQLARDYSVLKPFESVKTD